MLTCSRRQHRSVILAITVGNILEWYEIYLYVYWAPVMAQVFFHFPSETTNLINTFLIFAVGYLVRPMGGVFFGRLGDRIGRKEALILSITVMTIPTFLIGLLPSYAQVGLLAPILLGFLRLLQSFPAGGEVPGAFCFLYESAKKGSERFFCSWAFVGSQIGVIISMLECYFLEKYLPHEVLTTWGWRISFLVGGLIGLCGFYLRRQLKETPFFEKVETHHRVVRKSVWKVLFEYRSALKTAILFLGIDAVAFYLVSAAFPVYFQKVLGTDYSYNLMITIFILILTTVPLPFFGMLGDRVNNKKILISCTVGVILLVYPMCLAVLGSSFILTAICAVVMTLLLTCLFAILPYQIASLFPTPVRFTCVGLSFNIADSVLGGFTPVAAFYLLHLTGSEISFSWILLAGALISLGAYIAMEDRKFGLK